MDKRSTDKGCREAFLHGVAFPCDELRDFISHFWFSRWNTGVQMRLSYHSTASTNTEVVFAFAGHAGKKVPVFSSAQGHTEHYRCIDAGGFSDMFGVSIYAHAVPFFFGVSAPAFANQLVDLSEIVHTDIDAITDRLACSSGFSECVEIMTGYLKKRFNSARKTDLAILNAIKWIREKHGQVNILNLAREFSLSQKQFERRFKDFSGFNPKLYSRIQRFESALYPYNNRSRFTDIAAGLGYYDQAHFINDFRKFSGFSPGRYVPLSRY